MHNKPNQFPTETWTMTSPSKKKPAAKAMVFKQRGRPRKIELPLGATSWEDAYKKTLKNLERAYDRLVELQAIKEDYVRAQDELTGLATIINYLELRLEARYKGE